MNIFAIIVDTIAVIVWVLLAYYIVRPNLKGRIALRSVEELAKELGYDMSQYNYINKTSLYSNNQNKIRDIETSLDIKIHILAQRISILETQSSKLTSTKKHGNK